MVFKHFGLMIPLAPPQELGPQIAASIHRFLNCKNVQIKELVTQLMIHAKILRLASHTHTDKNIEMFCRHL